MTFDVNPSHAQEDIDRLQEEFPEATIKFTDVDITDDAAVAKAVEETAQILGSSGDILLCFAGVVDCTHAIEITPGQLKRTLEVNITGTFLCAQATARQMIKQKSRGSMMFVASIPGHQVNSPQPQVAYKVSLTGAGFLLASAAGSYMSGTDVVVDGGKILL
ncbi:oxidoreductase, short chain dehydrogenase/reductase family [Diplocarpon rosae]|nr:oxidoreductase, short chain dehydrogenase/reductase family [Diplocarpon rosae]